MIKVMLLINFKNILKKYIRAPGPSESSVEEKLVSFFDNTKDKMNVEILLKATETGPWKWKKIWGAGREGGRGERGKGGGGRGAGIDQKNVD